MGLVELFRSLGFRDISVRVVSRDFVRLVVDGIVVDIRRDGHRLYVAAYRVYPELAMMVWKYLSRYMSP